MELQQKTTKFDRMNDFYYWYYKVIKSTRLISDEEFNRIKDKI